MKSFDFIETCSSSVIRVSSSLASFILLVDCILFDKKGWAVISETFALGNVL